jgi:NitT/TauT family transport system substrate-binding protein
MPATRRTLLLGAPAAALALPGLARAQGGAALTPVKFCLDWAFQGPQAPYLLALDRGFFREEGLDVSIDRGFGSGDTPVKVASGAYQFGIADLSPTIRMRLASPDTDVIAPLVLQQGSPLAVMALKGRGITTPKDLAGKRIAAPETDSGRQLFPAFARAVGLDPASVTWISVTPQLREPMLMRREADAISGFEISGAFSLRSLGVAEGDIVSMRYADAGVPLLSTAVLVRRPYAEANPRVVTGMIRAIARGHAEALRAPDAAIAALVKRDPTAPADIEKARMMANFGFIRTPEVMQGGLGNLAMPRVQASIDMLREVFNIAAPLRAEDLYDPRYLPPAEALRLPA